MIKAAQAAGGDAISLHDPNGNGILCELNLTFLYLVY